MTRLASLALLPFLLLAGITQAHHGSAGQFDHSKTIEVSGVVQKIRFVNPHSYVYFNVTADDGSIEEWRCEMRAASVLKRAGWSEDMFAAGTVIDIVGVPARREPHGCYAETIALNDSIELARYEELEGAQALNVPRPMTLEDGTPNLSGNWVPQRPGGPPPEAAGMGAMGGMGGMGGPPGGGVPGQGRPSPYSQTEAGVAAGEGLTSEDNPRFHCQAVNIIHDYWFDEHVNSIEQSKDKIVIKYGFMDIVRTIHLDMNEHPDDIEPSRAGHSIGHWDGDTLVVDTIGFTPGFLDGRSGTLHSDQLHIVERFTRDDDGTTLVRTHRGEDPLYLSAPFEGRHEAVTTDALFDPYDCEDLTEEVVEGF